MYYIYYNNDKQEQYNNKETAIARYAEIAEEAKTHAITFCHLFFNSQPMLSFRLK